MIQSPYEWTVSVVPQLSATAFYPHGFATMDKTLCVRRPKGGGKHISPCREGIPLPGERTQGARQGTALQRTLRHNSADKDQLSPDEEA